MTSIPAETILKTIELIEGGSSERSACEQMGINRGTFRSAALRIGAADQYARATEALARDQVEKLETTIEELRAGTISVDVAKVEIDARKWIASKLFKPTWGDKTAVEHSGGFVVAGLPTSDLTDDQIQALASIPLKTS